MPLHCDMRFRRFWKRPGRDFQDPAEKTQREDGPPNETPPVLSIPQKKPLPATELAVPTEEEESQPPAPEAELEKQPTSPIQSPFGTTGDANVDDEIRTRWLGVQSLVAALASRRGESVNPGMRIDDVLGNLHSAQNDDEPPSGKQRAKDIFDGALSVVQKVGTLVAGAASNVRRSHSPSPYRVHSKFLTDIGLCSRQRLLQCYQLCHQCLPRLSGRV